MAKDGEPRGTHKIGKLGNAIGSGDTRHNLRQTTNSPAQGGEKVALKAFDRAPVSQAGGRFVSCSQGHIQTEKTDTEKKKEKTTKKTETLKIGQKKAGRCCVLAPPKRPHSIVIEVALATFSKTKSKESEHATN